VLSDDVTRKVRALLDRANHLGTPQAEAEAALAMAYRLMAKYDLDERLLTQQHDDAPPASDQIVRRRYETVGPYRVRRHSLFMRMAWVLSCACYRATNEEDTGTVAYYALGTERDLDALETLFQAAEMMALRLLPWGDRGFRTAWWHGFTDGIEAKLARERRSVERSTPGAALVLRDRTQRAEEEMIRIEPNLVWRTTRYSNSGNAYTDGRRAGSRFSSGRSSVGGGRAALPRGR
jgi:uncharacterized membrane protein YgcG